MSTTIDQQVVEMRFDNQHFEKNVQTSMSTLDKLKQKLNFSGASKGLDEINASTKRIDMSGLGRSIETVGLKFNGMYTIADQVLRNITTRVQQTSERIVKALTIDPISTGFSEYELKMGSIQTIMASTGESLETVNGYLEELNKYSDQTIYSFSDMTQNIGKFTNAGVKLEDAVMAIKGISNEAAVSGANANEASRAMYNFAQALSAGYVKLIDWKSIENANMATVEFKNQLIEAAVAAGTLEKQADGMYKVLTTNMTGSNLKENINATKMFNESLNYQWMTTEVLVNTLREYADETTEIGAKASKAATEVKTLTQLWDTLKESAQSGWAQTWELVVGDFYEAKDLFTKISEVVGGFIGKMSDARNSLLRGALTSKWEQVNDIIKKAGFTTEQFEEKLASVLEASGISADKLIKKYGSLSKAIQQGKIHASYITKALKKLIGIQDETSKATDKITMSVEELEAVAKRVINGEFGNGADRLKALTEAGYDYATVQNKVNELLGSSVRHNSDLTEAQLANADSLVKLSDAQLKEKGYTEEQIEALRELEKVAEDTDSTISELINNIQKPSGRQLLLESFKNMWTEIKRIFELIGEAWTNVFGEKDTDERANALYGLIEKFHDLTESMKMSEEQADNFRRILEGVFSALDLSWSLASVSFMGGLKILNELFKLFGTDLGTILGDIADLITKFNNWVEEETIFGSTTKYEDLAKILKAIFDGLGRCYEAFKGLGIAAGIIERLNNLFAELFGSFKDNPLKHFTVDSIVESITKLFDKLEAFIKGIETAPDLSKYLIEGITKGLTAGLQKLVTILTNVGRVVLDAIGGFFGANDKFFELGHNVIDGLHNGMSSGIESLVNIASKVFTVIYETIASLFQVHSPSRVMMALGGFIIAGLVLGIANSETALGGVVSGLGGKLLDAFKQVFSLVAGGIEQIDFGKIFAIGLSAGLIAVLKNLSDVLALFGAPFEAFGKLVGGLGSMFKSIGDGYEALLKSEAFKNRGKAIFNIALAIGVLVAAVAVIAKLDVDTKTLWKAVGVVGALAAIIAGLAAMMILLDKSTSELTGSLDSGGLLKGGNAKASLKISTAAFTILAMGASLALMAVALKKVSEIDGGGVAQAIGIFVLMIGGLVLILEEVNGIALLGKDINFKGISKIFTKLAIAMLLMVGVIKLASKLTVEEVISGTIVMSLIGLFYKSIIKSIQGIDAASVEQVGKLTRKISVSLLLMIGVIKLASMLSLSEVLRGGAVILGITGFYAAFIALTNLINKDAADSIRSAGGTLLKMSAAMLLMTFVIKMVAGMSWGDIGKGIAVIYGIGGVFAAITAVSHFSGAHAAKAGLMMLEMSAAMLIMTTILILLKDMPSEGIAKALGIMTAFTAMFGVLIGISYFAKHADKVKGTIIALTVAIGVLSIALIALTLLDENKVKTAAGALTAVIGVFALLLHASSYLKSGKKTWVRNLATIIALTAVVAALAGTIARLAALEPRNAIGAASSLGILLLSLSSSLLIMSKAKSFSKKNLTNMLITLGALSLIAIGLAYVIKSLGPIDPNSAIGAAIGIGSLLGALSVSLNIISRSKSISDKKLPGILATLGMLTAVALACTLMIYGLSKCDPKTSIGNAVALGILLAALSASLNIVAMSKSISATKLPGIIKSLVTLTVVTGLLAVILGTLSHLNAEPSIASATALSILLMTLSVAMIPLTAIGKFATNAVKGALALTAIAVPLAAFAFVLSKMPDLSNAQDNVILLANLMTDMTLLLVPLALIGNFVVPALGGVVALTAMVAPLSAFAFALSKMHDVSGLEATVMLLVNLMTAMTLLLVPLTVIGHFVAGALLGAVALTAMVVPLAAFAFALSKIPDLSGSIKSIQILSKFMDEMANVLIKVTLVSPFASMAITAILMLSGVILAFGVVATAIGALMDKFPALEEFLNYGMKILAGIAEGIGTILGKFITGFSNEIITILPTLGTALSDFMNGATDFINGIKMADESIVTGMKNLSKAILLLTGTELITGLVTLGGLDLVLLGMSLGEFAKSIVPFTKTLSELDPESVTAAKTLADLVLALASADFLTAITDIANKIFGMDEMDSFSTKLTEFVTVMADFATALKENDTKIDPKAIQDAAAAGLAMVKLANAIPRQEGFLEGIVGKRDLERFGSMCEAFGVAIRGMSDALTEDGGKIMAVNQGAIDAAVQAGQSMNKLAKAIPKSDGFLQDIVGESDLARFGTMCAAFGIAIRTMSSELVDGDGNILINDGAIDSAVKAGKAMSEIANAIPKKDGFLQDIVGEQDLEKFGNTCKMFGTAIREMSKSLVSEDGSTMLINETAITTAKNAGLMMAEVQKAIPADKWLDGKISIDDFGVKINSFGSSLVAYSNKVAEMDVTQVTNSITQAKRLVNLAKSLVDLDTSGISKFINVSSIASTMKTYAANLTDYDPGVVSSSISSATRLKNFIASLVDLDNSGISKFTLGTIGTSMKSYINSVKDMDTGVIHSSISAANRLKDFIRGLVDLDASGIPNFRPAQIGSAIRAYATNVVGIDPEAISISISAANRLKNFIASLVGLDTSGVDSFSSAASKLGQVNVDGFVKAFSGSAGKLNSAGVSMMDSLINGIQSRQAVLTTSANAMVNSMANAINSKQSMFKTAGAQIMVQFIQGMNSKRSTIKSAMTTSLNAAVQAARDKYTSFYNAGSYLVDGFASGISANTFMAEAKAAAMAQAALQAAKAALDINSPSKVFREIGKSVPEGFAQGIGMLGNLVKDSSVGMTDVALDGVSSAISTIADAVNADIDSQPVIRPVLDLSDITSGAGAINGMFGMTPSVGVMANVGSISSMMNKNQNGTNADIVSAINKLRSDLGSVRGDTYQLGNITYDDGSNISEAVKSLVRAAKVERRI